MVVPTLRASPGISVIGSAQSSSVANHSCGILMRKPDVFVRLSIMHSLPSLKIARFMPIPYTPTVGSFPLFAPKGRPSRKASSLRLSGMPPQLSLMLNSSPESESRVKILVGSLDIGMIAPRP